jgi:CubicO group peptidase (beta-lactamase class C family)
MSPHLMAHTAALFCLCACASSPTDLLREATGSVSQNLCTKTLASTLSPEAVMREHLLPEPGMRAIAWGLRYEVDREAGEVRASVFGGSASRSVFHAGRGCTLVDRSTEAPAALTPLAHTPALLPEIAATEIVTPQDPRLVAALDAAFAEPDRGGPRNTQAIVVVRSGRIIAERYAPGLNTDTPLLSHSIAKSVVNALVGVLVRDSAMRVEDAAPVALWRGDGRGAITIDNLLRMNAGFGFDEGGGASIATHIWYTEPDTALAAARAEPETTPGAQWGYCSRCYILLSRAIGDTVGGGPQGVRDFAQREVFDPLGMHSVTLEFDAAGTMMGANSMLATPRDWARFGLLYLHDGVVGERRILPEGWVDYATRPTGEAGYGAGFWLNTTDAEIADWRMRWGIPGAPRDAYMARGYMGQYVVIVPSEDLVVVRFGQSHARASDVASVGQLVRDIIAARD